MKASVGGGSFELPTAGQHSARIYSIVDIGMQPDIFNPPKKKQQIIVTWELVDTEMEDGRPFVISKFYSLSLNQKSNLRKDLKNMSGKALTDDQAGKFDFTKLINFACNLVISIEEKDDKEKAVIQAMLPAAKGVEVTALKNPTIFFDTEMVDIDIFNAIPEWQRKFIDEDLIHKLSKDVPAKQEAKPQESAPNKELEEDDIPW